MPTSISSSSERIGGTPLGKAWLLAIAVCGLALVPWELFWRSRGFEPALTDGPLLWSLHRRRASALGHRALAITGGSRAQVGLDLEVLADRTGLEPVQLAIDATTFAPVLEDLAHDRRFCGTVLVSMTAGKLEPSSHTRAHEYIEFDRSMGLYGTWETRLSVAAEGSLVCRSPALSHNAILWALVKRRMPTPTGPRVLPDRSRRNDYTRIDPEPRKRRVEAALAAGPVRSSFSPAEFMARCAEMEGWVERIRRRGGRVIFVRMPTSGAHWALDEASYPRKEYWDRFAATTSSPTVHFRDYETLAHFECPDTSHLDAKDVTPFTTALMDVLEGAFAH